MIRTRVGLRARSIYTFIAIMIGMMLIGETQTSAQSSPPFLGYLNHPWVDSTLKTLNTNQQITQSIWLAAWSDKGPEHTLEIADAIKTWGIGGLVFFQGTRERQKELVNLYQGLSKVPLTMAIDAEWGTGMRLTDVPKFPYQMTLGAIRNDSLIFKMGLLVAEQCRNIGVHINLAPVADINNNPLNPVINYRSFGEDKANVAAKSTMYSQGLQSGGVLATGKHFPGHGDTETDSHYDLPLLKHSKTRFDTLELEPFRAIISGGIGAIMTAHLNIPALDSTPGIPSTLSPLIITNLLKGEMGFKGLVISDAMNMKGLTNHFPDGEASAMAYLAGNDVIEYVTDIESSVKAISLMLTSGAITKADIEARCRKILAFKKWSTDNQPTKPKDGLRDREEALIRTLYENALTLLVNNDNSVPVRSLAGKSIATLSINRSAKGEFELTAGNYKACDNYFLPAGKIDVERLIDRLGNYDLIIVPVFGTDQRASKNYGITADIYNTIDLLATRLPVLFVYFGNPYALDKLPDISKSKGLLLAYQESPVAESVAAQILFGGVGARGRLPVSLYRNYKIGDGILTPGGLRMSYGKAEQVGMSTALIARRVDSIANFAMRAGAFPGCEVMAARDGRVIFHKSYGYHTYDNRVANIPGDLYDIASVTKIISSLPALMILQGEGRFSPDQKLGDYLSEMKNSDKGDLLLRDMMTHQAGLSAWIPFWKEGVKDDGSLKTRTFRTYSSGKFTIIVADDLFVHANYRRKILKEISDSPLGEKKYLYSDLTFILTPMIVERITGEPWVGYLDRNVFQRLGASDITFNPHLSRKPVTIVPTEEDSLFRHQLLQGYVHDEGSAMLGGVSGHAGLFATGNDLMKVLELYRRGGNYGGEQIIPETVLREYSNYQFPENGNRRGLGFDKPQLPETIKAGDPPYPNQSATPSSFGHSGYTGTFVWIDPEMGISYLFLSNRVYPTRNNNKISELNVRTEILQALYNSITD